VGNGISLEIIELLLKESSNINNQDSLFMSTYLHDAVYNNKEDVVELLLSKGANVNLSNGMGDTALHFAVSRKDSIRIVQRLLTHPDININQKNSHGETALDHAIKSGSMVSVGAILSKGAKLNLVEEGKVDSPFIYLCRDFDANNQLVKYIWNSKNVIKCNEQGETVLHRMVKVGKINAIRALTRLPDFDINVKDKKGLTPLHYALETYEPNMNLIKFLLTIDGIDIEAKVNDMTPRELAERKGNKEIVELFDQFSKGDFQQSTHAASLMSYVDEDVSILEGIDDLFCRQLKYDAYKAMDFMMGKGAMR
jgi:ankyrin repeat protein